MTNRKSHTPFRLMPNERPWTTLNGRLHSIAEKMRLSKPTTKIWMKIGPYHQRQQCSPPMPLVYGGIRFMRLHAEVTWEGRQMSVGLSTTAIFSVFAGYFFGNFRDKLVGELVCSLRGFPWTVTIRDKWHHRSHDHKFCNICSPMLYVVNLKQPSVSDGFWDITLQIYRGHDLDLLMTSSVTWPLDS